MTPVERTALKVGESFPLGTAGRSFGAEAELQVSASKLLRVHGRISFRDGTWRLGHSAAELRTLVNGSPVHDATLQHLDVIELPDFGPVFRFFTAAPGSTVAGPESLSLDDAPRLAVWADALLEANDPLGERIAHALKQPDNRPTQAAHPSTALGTNGASLGRIEGASDLRWLGPLARTWTEGRLDVEWTNGLLRRAVLRDLQLFGAEPLTSIDQLLRLPVARYLESLTLDAGGAQSTAQAFVEILRNAQTIAPMTLTHLSLGDVSYADAWADEASLRFRQLLKPRFPNLTGALFGRFKRATLVGGKQVQDLGDTAELIDVAPPSGGTAGVAFWRLQRKHAHWEIEAVPPSPSGITLNGRPVTRAALRDDDQLQLSTGAVYRFKLER